MEVMGIMWSPLLLSFTLCIYVVSSALHLTFSGTIWPVLSLAVLSMKVDCSMNELSPLLSVACHSDPLFHCHSSPVDDVIHPYTLGSSLFSATISCALYYFLFQAGACEVLPVQVPCDVVKVWKFFVLNGFQKGFLLHMPSPVPKILVLFSIKDTRRSALVFSSQKP